MYLRTGRGSAQGVVCGQETRGIQRYLRLPSSTRDSQRHSGLSAPPSGPITVSKLAANLTDLVFWARHPSLADKAVKPGTKEAIEWSQILKDEIRPAFHNSSTRWRVGQLIFFARHPAILGHFKDQPKPQQLALSQEFDDIRNNIVGPWLTVQLARGPVNSRTIFVVDNDTLQALPWETRTRAGDELALQFAFVNGGAPMTVIFLESTRFPEAFNLSDAVVTVTEVPPATHVEAALKQQVNNLNRAIRALGSRFSFRPPDHGSMIPDRNGSASRNKLVTSAAQGTRVAAPLMSSAVGLKELINDLNEEYIPAVYSHGKDISKNAIPDDKTKWTPQHKELVGIALGRAMAHEVRHLYVGTPIHAADGLGSDGARLFGKDPITFSVIDRASIQAAISGLESQQGTRAVAASFAAAERSLDFPF